MSLPSGERRMAESRALLGAELLSLAGDQLAKVAISVLVFDRTGSASLAAAAYALTFLPALAGGMGLARIADVRPRREVLAVGLVAQGVAIAAAVLAGLGTASTFVLYAVAALLSAVTNAALSALYRDVIPMDANDRFLAFQESRAVVTNLTMLAGLGGAGVLVALTGPGVALAVDAASFGVAAVLVQVRLRSRPAPAEAVGEADRPRVWARLLRQRRRRTMLGMAGLVGFAVVPEGLAVPIAAEFGSDVGPGLILAADPCGFTLGVLLVRRFVPPERRERVVGPLAVASVLLLVVVPAAPSLVVVLAMIALSGAAGAYLVTVNSLFANETGSATRASEIGAYRMVLRVSQGIGVVLGGVLADQVGARSAVGIAGLAGTALGLGLWRAWHASAAKDCVT